MNIKNLNITAEQKQIMYSVIINQIVEIPQNPLYAVAVASAIRRGNKRFVDEYWHFELIEQVFNQCKKQKMNVIREDELEYLMSGYCGFKIQTLSGKMSIIVNESGMIEILTQMKEGEHRRFTSGDRDENDNYNPWFNPEDSWMDEIKRVHEIMNHPAVVLSKSQKRRLRAKQSKLARQTKNENLKI